MFLNCVSYLNTFFSCVFPVSRVTCKTTPGNGAREAKPVVWLVGSMRMFCAAVRHLAACLCQLQFVDIHTKPFENDQVQVYSTVESWRGMPKQFPSSVLKRFAHQFDSLITEKWRPRRRRCSTFDLCIHEPTTPSKTATHS